MESYSVNLNCDRRYWQSHRHKSPMTFYLTKERYESVSRNHKCQRMKGRGRWRVKCVCGGWEVEAKENKKKLLRPSQAFMDMFFS